ncbi:MAG: hypothetical protein IJP15_00880 [Oscillospiraceae bacterium]|nr:hypothetical protein [Oscillospiraceae bacterium]
MIYDKDKEPACISNAYRINGGAYNPSKPVRDLAGIEARHTYRIPEDGFAFIFTEKRENTHNFIPGDLLIVDPEQKTDGLVAVLFSGRNWAELRDMITYNSQERAFMPIIDGVPIIYENVDTPESERVRVLGRVCRLFRSLEDVYTENKEESKNEKA